MGIMGDFDRYSWVLLLTSSAVMLLLVLLGVSIWLAGIAVLIAFTIDLLRDMRRHPFHPDDFLDR